MSTKRGCDLLYLLVSSTSTVGPPRLKIGKGSQRKPLDPRLPSVRSVQAPAKAEADTPKPAEGEIHSGKLT